MSSVKAVNVIKTLNKNLSPDLNKGAVKMANVLSKFKGEDALIPILLIESCVTGGRTLAAYKRGGMTEARERFTEQSVGAVVWLFGVKVLNTLADKLGGLFLNKEHINVDVAKDALRDPFNNIIKEGKLKMSIFKFGKIAINTAIATVFIGFILPKMIQKMTDKRLQQDQNTQNQNVAQKAKQDTTQIQKSDNIQNKNNAPSNEVIATDQSAINKNDDISTDNSAKVTNAQNGKNVSFKGLGVAETLLSLTNKLEHDVRYRLMSTDVGIITGRTVNARNKYEAREFLFRDTASVYFYIFCAPHLFKLLSKLTGNVDIHPQAALALSNMLLKDPEKLKTLAQNMTEESPVNVDELFKNAKNDVIPFETFKNAYGNNLAIIEKAKKMAGLQPIFDDKMFLSKQQVQDVLSNKVTSDPDFLYEVFNRVTKGKFAKKDKYVSKKELEGIRKSLDQFTEKIIKYAQKKNGGEITADVVNKCLKKNVALNSLFTFLGIAVSGAALALLIPKIQNYITKKATGSDEFPGVAKYDK